MTRPLLLVGSSGLHHNQRWLGLCAELGLAVHFHELAGRTQALSQMPDPMSGRLPPRERADGHAMRVGLAEAIDRLSPFAVHALGSHPAGLLCRDAIRLSRTRPRLITHLRGGAELDLYRHDPAHAAALRTLMSDTDVVIADNAWNYRLARELGFRDPYGLAFEVCIPGNCGELPSGLEPLRTTLPAAPTLIWPKAFANPNVAPYPIVEAVARLWESGRRFRLRAFGLEMAELLFWIRRRFAEVDGACFEANGPVPRAQFIAALAEAHVMLSPSLFDGVSNVMLEAMALGVLPVVSAHRGMPEALLDTGAVRLADNLDPEAIARAVADALDLDAVERQAQLESNRAWALEHCDRGAIRVRVARLYARLGGPPAEDA